MAALSARRSRLSLSPFSEQNYKALLDRPRFSLRLQLSLGFFLAFLISSIVALVLVYSFQGVEGKIRFLEIVSDYVMEVEQARRFEKNYFLYGTNLSDALDNVFQAEQILTRNAEELTVVMGSGWDQAMLPNLRNYQKSLEQLGELQRKGESPSTVSARRDLQLTVRKQGQQMVSAALELLDSEKASLSTTLYRSRQLLIYSLVFLLLIMLGNVYLLGSRMLGAINRFGEYARRIALGDFTPITPSRRYRDEFTQLAVAINSMIEELEVREAVLIQSHKMRAVGTLTAGVAHELNNPLNNITLTAHVLQEEYPDLDDEERLEMVGDVVDEAARAKKIISNLLDFARETGSQMEPLNLPSLLKETIDLAANQIKLLGIKIEMQAADNLPLVHGDSQQLRQVFLNLILNAIDASHKGGKIQVWVMPADESNYVAVKVSDFGTGIPEHILASIFDPFFTTKARGKGTGLGLSVSQGIVAKHGGRIMVNSRAGEGSTFTVVLPVTTIPAELGRQENS
ncbi:MAG: HAMP domain-containing protein [Deltaproteobacteria bacterium]|nr:HAMP domain-containing protein [Deltaproteobacteria bacterium]